MMQVQKPKQGYKLVKTLFGKYNIPEEWKLEKLGNHSTLFVPMRDKPKKFGGEIDWLRIEDFDGKYVSRSKSNQKVSLDTIKEMKLRVYPVGTVLCSCSATIGAYAITARELITNQTFIGIYPHDDLDKEFLYYYLNTQTKNLIKIGSGTTILYISREKFEGFPIIFPPLHEQQKIASILSNVDSIIQQTEKEIEQTQRLKKGLMQKLLTKGIGHTKFKKINLGGQLQIDVPLSWNVKSLDELSLNGTQNGYAIAATDYGKGTPMVGMTDLFENDVLDPTNLKEVVIPEKIIQNFSLRDGDLLFARRSLNVEGAGKCVLVSKITKPIIFESSIIRMSLKIDVVLSIYVNYLLNSDLGKRLLTRIKQTVAVSGITSSELKRIEIPLPEDLREQRKIISILSNIDSQIQKQQEYKSNLENLKKGLMQKLLTGQIRVKV